MAETDTTILQDEIGRLHADVRRLTLLVDRLTLQRNHWKREALAYFKRLAPLIGNATGQPVGTAEDQKKAQELTEDRDAIAQAIARRAPPGDKEYEKRLWDFAEREIAARGTGHGDEIASDIMSGDAGDRVEEEELG
jgi:hypothetical protein